MRRAVLLALLAAAIIGAPASARHARGVAGPVVVGSTWFGATLPTAPATFTTTMPGTLSCASTNHGSCYAPTSAATLQADITAAAGNSGALGDIIEVNPADSYAYSGQYNLPAQTGTGWIYIINTNAPEIGGSGFPSQGTRVCPSGTQHAIIVNGASCSSNTSLASMPALTTTANNTHCTLITTSNGASKYRLVGLNVGCTDANANGGGDQLEYVIDLSHGDTSVTTLSTYIILDRDYIAGAPTYGATHCYDIDGAYNAVIESVIDQCWTNGNADSQAVVGWNGTGPYIIHDNWMHAGGETFMFGGSDTALPSQDISADITITNNHFFKNSFVGTGHVTNGSTTLTITAVSQDLLTPSMTNITDANSYIPAFNTIVAQLTGTGGATCPDTTCNGTTGTYQLTSAATGTTSGSVAITGTEQGKNMGEFKAAQRASYQNNYLENAGAEGQSRSAFTLTARNQSGGNSWNVISDIDVENNVFTNGAFGGMNWLLQDSTVAEGGEGEGDTLPAARILIRNNLFMLTTSLGSADAFLLLQSNEPASSGGTSAGGGGGGSDITVDHNTFVNTNVSGDSGLWFGGAGTGIANMQLSRVVLSDNIFTDISTKMGNCCGSNAGFAASFPPQVSQGAVVSNVFTGVTDTYPATNANPSANTSIGFTSFGSVTSAAGYILTSGSAYHAVGVSGAGLPYTSTGTPDGSDLGANISLLPTS